VAEIGALKGHTIKILAKLSYNRKNIMQENVKKILIKAVKSPMIAIVNIIKTNDSDSAKLRAINLYCMFILKTINKTIIKYVENEK